MPITIAICDDEKNMAEHLMNLIKSDTQTSTKNLSIDLYSSGDALLAANKDYDICFLDIQMPGLN
ncbi:MAG: response regulator, partial [Defluviitaleaceae bacterium]|nr:response regulator [Defluviitaleaceae bacterium]